MDDRFEELRTYVAIVEHGGINAAAAALGIARSAPSRRLSDLERRLGTTLIDRTTRRFEVTAVGRDYHRRAKAILAALAELDDPHGSTATHERVTVGAEPWLAAGLVAAALAAFRKLRPEVAIDLVPLLDPSGADLSVLASGSADQDADALEAGTVGMVIVAAPTYLQERATPTTMAGLADHDGIHIDLPALAWRGLSRDAPSPRVAMRVPDAVSALAAAIAGGGAAQLPDFCVREAVAAGTLVTLLHETPPPPIAVKVAVRADASGSARALADHLASTLIPSKRR